KTGIDTPQGKNLIGAFHQPGLVLADTDTLRTLPLRELRAGYAEVAKYGLLGDAPFFAWLEKNHHAVFALEDEPLTHAVETSVKAKAGIVGRDETEQGERALLNLGHTFGHAFEAWCGYSDRLLHGEAISIGMAIAFRFSAARGDCSAADAERAAAHFAAVGLPTRIDEIPGDKPGIDAMMKLMAQDKKVRQGKLTFILARGIGEAYIAHDVPDAEVRAFLGGEIA
ncbi:MAG TPA: 3-dehydroquinate synthase family protein, partial [Hyphomicrobium sp.]|nr:3-dehydroquinate synthase family protein [Hyphomicrobium sp.]